MGFPNVDKFLVRRFMEGFRAVQADPATVIDDLFEDLDELERADIGLYVSQRVVTDDIKERGDGLKHLYILPSFPLADEPFPQIGISLGNEADTERFIGNDIGEPPVEVKDAAGTIIAYDIHKGYWASGSWNVDVVTATKDEAVWLSRFCQLFVCQAFDDLDKMGVHEVGVVLQDIKLNPDSAMQPNNIMVRGLRITAGKVANTWKIRVPASYYQTGINKAL